MALGIKGDTIFKTLYDDYNILFDLKHIYDDLGMPSYNDHSELDMMLRNSNKHKYFLGKERGEMMVKSGNPWQHIKTGGPPLLRQR